MPVYVDDAYIPAKIGRFEAKWCHLTADTPDELMAFARGLGLNSSWLQYPGTWKEHFDVTMTVRRRAVASGAIEVSRRDAVLALRQRWRAKNPEPHIGPSHEPETPREEKRPLPYT